MHIEAKYRYVPHVVFWKSRSTLMLPVYPPLCKTQPCPTPQPQGDATSYGRIQGFLLSNVLTSSPSPFPLVCPSCPSTSYSCSSVPSTADSSPPPFSPLPFLPSDLVCFSSWNNSSALSPFTFAWESNICPTALYSTNLEKGSHVLEWEPVPSTSRDPGSSLRSFRICREIFIFLISL